MGFPMIPRAGQYLELGKLGRADALTAVGERRAAWIAQARRSSYANFIAEPSVEVGSEPLAVTLANQASVIAVMRLQDIADYRGALQGWFRALRPGGHLLITVPHAFLDERQLSMPSSRSPRRRRIYTPASLLGEVEEALAPNSYRVRHVSDLDGGYDYSEATTDEKISGESELLIVLEKLVSPDWKPALVLEPELKSDQLHRRDQPDYGFEPARTRIEVETRPVLRRILLMKLDHLGDFIMGLDALERARRQFAHADLTLVVGSWNVDMARSLGLANRVVGFDAFPRNSSEEEVDVPGKAALFQQVVTGEYDLAVDLRTDHDTRRLLRLVNAPIRAGIGSRAQFPFLDIFLPIDFTRGEPESAREVIFNPHDFINQGSAQKSDHRIFSRASTAERNCAIVWGPYRRLRPGRYIFEPWFEVEPGDGMLVLDVALNAERQLQDVVRATRQLRLEFTVERTDAEFEFRLWAVEGQPSLDVSFFGGRLIRQGAASVLHQSEYLSLLLELIAIRLTRTGVLTELGGP